jgi:hypothetical protein
MSGWYAAALEQLEGRRLAWQVDDVDRCVPAERRQT